MLLMKRHSSPTTPQQRLREVRPSITTTFLLPELTAGKARYARACNSGKGKLKKGAGFAGTISRNAKVSGESKGDAYWT